MLHKNYILIIILIILTNLNKGFSQFKISGVLVDQNNNAITNCPVFFYNSENQILLDFVITNEQGKFDYVISGQIAYPIQIETNCQFFINKSVNVDFTNSLELELVLKEKIFELKEVVIEEKAPIQIKKDTTIYNIEALKRTDDRKIIDVLSRLSGFDIDKKTGLIKFKGKPIKAFLLDGDDLFNSNYTFGSKNISVDLVDKVEAIEDYQKDKLKKGIVTSDEVAVNLILKENKNDINNEANFAYGLKNHNTSLTSLYTSKKHKFLLNAESNDISKNESPLEESTYNALNQEEIEKYSHNPFRLNSVFDNEEFGRSYDNNLKQVNANFHERINKKLSFTSSFNFYGDRINREIASSTQFKTVEEVILNDDNASNKVQPRFFKFNTLFMFELNKNTSMKYFVNLYNRSYNNSQRVVQNNNKSFTSKLSMTQLFINQEVLFLKKINSKLLYEFGFNHSVDNSGNDIFFEKIFTVINDTIQKSHYSGHKTSSELTNAVYLKKGQTEFKTGLKMTFESDKNTLSTNDLNQFKTKLNDNKLEWFSSMFLNYNKWSLKSTLSPFYSYRELSNSVIERKKNLNIRFHT